MVALLNRKSSRKIVQRTWGTEEWVVNGTYCCKQMVLKPLHWSSLHFHMEKHETFLAQSPFNVSLVVFHEKDLTHFKEWGRFPDIAECEGKVLVKHREQDFIVPGLITKTHHLRIGDSLEIEPYTGHFFFTKEEGYFPFIEVSTHHDDNDVYRILEGGPAL